MKRPLGVLLIHGFTGFAETVSGLVPHLEATGLPYRMPALRGHWTRPEDLVGVTYHDWVEDATSALDDLLTECEQAVVVGLSMGGLVALKLAMERPDHVRGVASVASALRFKDPLTNLTPLMARLFKFWPMPKAPKGVAYEAKNYPVFPTQAFVSLMDFTRHIEANLPRVQTPLLVLQSRVDQTVHPVAASIIFERAGSKEKEIHWFERSGHEMMMDREKDRVFDLILGFIQTLAPEARQSV